MKCVMCKETKKICNSHIIPKLFGKYIKSNSLSGGLRNPNEVNIRKQDLYKISLLCEECEEIFSKLETEFKKEVFDKIAVELNNDEKKLRIEKKDELLKIYSKNELKNLEITKEIYDFVISIFYRIAISNGINLEEWYDDEKELLKNFIKKAEEYFLTDNKEIKFDGKFYLINSNMILKKIISEEKKEYIENAIEVLYTGVYYPYSQLFPVPNSIYTEKYIRIFIGTPYFIMAYELYPNENFEKTSSEELKIGNIIFKENCEISMSLIECIFNDAIKLLNNGKNNLSVVQKEKIINSSIIKN